MQGSFSEEALKAYSQLAEQLHGENFAEASSEYDFARCIRPDGSAFGTSGKCTAPNRPAPSSKALQEAEKLEKEAEEVTSGGRRHSRAMQALAERLRAAAQAKRTGA